MDRTARAGSQRRKWAKPWIVGLAILGLSYWVITTSESTEGFVHEHKHDERYKALYQSHSVVERAVVRIRLNIAVLGHFTDKNEGAVTALATVLLTVFTWTLWRATRNLVLGAEDTAERQLRAYVSVEVGALADQNPKAGSVFEFQPIIKNTGQTPAYELTYVSRACFMPYPTPKSYDFNLVQMLNKSAVTLGANQISSMFCGVDRLLTDAEMKEAKAKGGRHLCVYGRVMYRDAFRRQRYTEFFYALLWSTKGHIIWISGEYNTNAT